MLARLGFEEFVDLLMACVCSVQYRVPYNDQETESLYLSGVFVKEIPANQRPYRYTSGPYETRQEHNAMLSRTLCYLMGFGFVVRKPSSALLARTKKQVK
jgi:hypothetical protein